jgi:hypothetical protein
MMRVRVPYVNEMLVRSVGAAVLVNPPAGEFDVAARGEPTLMFSI